MNLASNRHLYAAINAILLVLLFGEVASAISLGVGVSFGAVLTVGSLSIAFIALGLSRMAFIVRLPVIFWLVLVWFLVRGVAVDNALAGAQQTATWLLFTASVIAARAASFSARSKKRLLGILVVIAVIWGILQIVAVGAGILGYGFPIAINRPTAAMLVVLAAVPVSRAVMKGDMGALLVSALLFVAILASESRTATLAFIVMAATILLLEVSRRPRWVPKRPMLYGLVGVVVVALAFGLTSFGERIETTFRALPTIVSERSSGALRGLTQGRSYVWPRLIDFATESPTRLLVGDGAGAASAASARITADNPWAHPHNEFLRVLIDYGLAGLVLFVALLARIALMFASRFRVVARHHPLLRLGPLAGLGAFVAMVALMLTDNPLTYPYVMVAFGLITGLGASTIEGHG